MAIKNDTGCRELPRLAMALHDSPQMRTSCIYSARQLLGQVKARGEPAAEDVSIAAHLLRLRDPKTGQPLPDSLLAGEFGMYFSAGLETSGNAISWTL